MGAFDRYGYGPVSAVYDEIAGFYSLGRIDETKRLSTEHLKPGDRVLYPGVGRGREAFAAVALGASVTAVDLSSEMLGRFRNKLEGQGLHAELIEADVSQHQPESVYDVVVANYFLNLFEASRASAMLDQLAQWLRPGGLLLISDFARPSGSLLGQMLSELYYRPVNAVAWALGLCALHPILDYASMLDPTRFRIRSVQHLPLWRGRNPAYMSLVAERLVD